jgi:hypothetical protein
MNIGDTLIATREFSCCGVDVAEGDIFVVICEDDGSAHGPRGHTLLHPLHGLIVWRREWADYTYFLLHQYYV